MNKFDMTKFNLPKELGEILQGAKSVWWARSISELQDAACGGAQSDSFEVAYGLSSGKRVVEATVARVRNGIVVNYPEPYMRRREPDCMVIADDLPSEKPRFRERFGYEFDGLRNDTAQWLKSRDLVVFCFKAGQMESGVDSMVVAPANAGFFALSLALLQGIIPPEEMEPGYSPQSIIYVAPPFRHTHFSGKQVVVHHRQEQGRGLHEIFAYNLYPGPSAKKGVYGALINWAEREGWVVPHCSAVQVITPYDNVVTMMHEGASGGGKSEMLEQVHREADGRLLLGQNLVTGERRYVEIPRACALRPVTDDMALCHPSLQKGDGFLHLADAENSWFVRVNHIREYGTDPFMEKLTAQPSEGLVFINLDAVPGSRALIWEHIEDSPGRPCPNPRVILPRRLVPGIVNEPVAVDIRGYGVRTPPCTKKEPTYGILVLFHLLPPALAWLWRLAAPRGYSNPSIIETEGMESEGVGAYWPFATGKRVTQANLLLEQIRKTPNVRYVLYPNQHIGAWATGFMPQWIAREYLARHGHARFKPDQIQASRCPLLGYTLNQLSVEGRIIPMRFLQVNQQPEVGDEAYDQGAGILYDFFRRQLAEFLDPELDPLGRRIIESCMNKVGVDEYEKLM